MSKDHEYIKELFDSDGIRAPESLSEENMLAMLNAAEEKQPAETQTEKHFEPKRAKARPSMKRWIAVAAVAVIAVFGISGLRDILTGPPDTDTPPYGCCAAAASIIRTGAGIRRWSCLPGGSSIWHFI